MIYFLAVGLSRRHAREGNNFCPKTRTQENWLWTRYFCTERAGAYVKVKFLRNCWWRSSSFGELAAIDGGELVSL
jgi:hypothetical protein